MGLGNPVLEVKPNVQCGLRGNVAVAGAASETFAWLLYHLYDPVDCYRGAEHIVSLHDTCSEFQRTFYRC